MGLAGASAARAVEESRAGVSRSFPVERALEARLRRQPTPSLARSIAGALALNDRDVFFLAQRDGRVPLRGQHGFGRFSAKPSPDRGVCPAAYFALPRASHSSASTR